MKIFISKLCSTFKKNPRGIIGILIMDILEMGLFSMNPYFIGACIDGILEHDYFWLFMLIGLQVFLLSIRAINNIYDTRVYERIIANESILYYAQATQEQVDDSQISSRLNLVDEFPNFFDTELVQIIAVVGESIFALVFIFMLSGLPLLLFASVISVAIFFITKNPHAAIAQNNIVLQNYDEIREAIISSRNNQNFKNFITVIRDLRVKNSDLNAKSYLITDILQVILLIAVSISIIYTENHTSGQLFSVVTYVMMLSNNACEINELRVRIYDLIDSANRLEKVKPN